MNDFLVHYKEPVMKRPRCNTGFFIKTTTRPHDVTCPACKELIKEQENKGNATNIKRP